MLRLLVKRGEDIIIVDNEGNELVRIVSSHLNPSNVRLAFEFKKEVGVWRGDIHRRKLAEEGVK